MRKLTLPIAGLTAAMLSGPGAVSAGTEIFDNTVSSCTGLNCSSLTLPGTVLGFGPSASAWVANLFAAPGECVRLSVTSQGTDLEMVVVAPNGQVFRNDDGIGLNPLVKIAGAPNNGWYTVHLSRFNGAAVDANFTLLYGRYTPASNPNCAGATIPFSATSEIEDDSKFDSGVRTPRAGTPGSAE